MKKFFVVGNPIKNSLSPLIFNYWFRFYKMKHRYEKKLMQQKNFKKDFLKTINSKQCFGINITTPFKNNLSSIVDFETKQAKIIGAINCVYKKNKKIIGANTDWEGYIKSLKYQNKNPNKNIAAIIGFGGATKAIVYALRQMKFKKIKVFIRNKQKLTQLKKENKNISFYNINSINRSAKEFDLLVNSTTTSVVSKLKIDLSVLNKKCVVSDINYIPHNTDLTKKAKQQNLKVSFGIYMLLFQAAPSFYRWFGFMPTINKDLVEKCIRRKKK